MMSIRAKIKVIGHTHTLRAPKNNTRQNIKNCQANIASTTNTSVATGMETFKNLKMVPSVHHLYASWITKSNPLFVLISIIHRLFILYSFFTLRLSQFILFSCCASHIVFMRISPTLARKYRKYSKGDEQIIERSKENCSDALQSSTFTQLAKKCHFWVRNSDKRWTQHFWIQNSKY